MSPQDLKNAIKNAQSGDAEAFVALVAYLQRDLRVLIASFASSPSMVDSVIVETWSDCRNNIDQCPASMAAISWLRVTASKHLVRRLETELDQERRRNDSLKLLIIPSAIEQFNVSPTPSNAQGNKVHEKFQKLDPAVRDQLTLHYAQGFSLERCASELGDGATVASVARMFFLAREKIDWRDGDQVSFANADWRFVSLLEEYLSGSISAESREKLWTMTEHDRIRATQFGRQIRIDMLLSALLGSAGSDDARRLISRLTQPPAIRRPSERNLPNGGTTPASSALHPPAEPRTAVRGPPADAEGGGHRRTSGYSPSHLHFGIGGALLVVCLVVVYALTSTAVAPPTSKPSSEPALKDLGKDGSSAPVQSPSPPFPSSTQDVHTPIIAAPFDQVKGGTLASTSNPLRASSGQPASQAAQVAVSRTDGEWTDLPIGPPVIGEACDSSETHGAAASWVEGFCPPFMNGNAVGRQLPQLVDLSLPTSNDDIARNVWFDGPESRIVVDLKKPIEVSRVATYSWHKSNRAMQLFTLWGAEGEAMPNAGLDDLAEKWVRIAHVDTTSLMEGGKQGSSVTSPNGSLGKFRWLLWQSPARHEGTFYSKLCVFDRRRVQP